jgi:RNA recognition motif-containing protein
LEVFDDPFVFSIPIVDSFNQKESTAILIIKESIQNMEIYVGNLPWSVKDQDLADAFSEFGTVDRASVIT